MSSLPLTTEGRSDAELIIAARAGDVEAFGLLYARHLAAARNLARQLVRAPAEADDLVSEAFSKVLETLRSGGGPDSAFRAYLLATLRNTLYDKARRDRRVEYSDDLSRVDPGVPFVDTALEELEAALVARAFSSLPERWQTVLWHTEVEGETPAQVAPLLGLTPNGVSALAYRAREGLRQAYLQVHLQDAAGEQCRYTVERLGAWARYGLARRERAQVDAHLAACHRCRALAAELADVNGGLRAVLAPLVLGVPWAMGYLAEAGAAKAASGTAGAAGAAGTTGAAGAAGGAVAGGEAVSVGVGVGAAAETTAGSYAAGSAATSLLPAAAASGAGTAGGAGGGVGGAVAKAGLLAKLLPIPASQAAVGAGATVIAGAVAVGLALAPHHPGTPSPGRPPGSALSESQVGGTTTGGGPGPSAWPSWSADGHSSAAPGRRSGGAGPGGPAAGQPVGSPPSSATASSAEFAGPPAIAVGSPAVVGVLRQGLPGLVTISVRNDGGGARSLSASIALPAGIALRRQSGTADAGGSLPASSTGPALTASPAPGTQAPAVADSPSLTAADEGQPEPVVAVPPVWRCAPVPGGAACSLASLPPGATSTILLRLLVGSTAESGMLTGQLTAAGGVSVPVPATLLPVAPA